VRVSSDHQRLRAELRALQLLDGRKECVEIEVCDDHPSVALFGRLRWRSASADVGCAHARRFAEYEGV
jgi:hypothetical protein